ncbi:class I SAM-dependent methyltransferase [Agromyces sp. NPDC049794]|uniref:SAM-dependent methyltransferase n=1 Tax=unclassified Agromyces TaxID=2639701 RepID=UPI0033C53376
MAAAIPERVRWAVEHLEPRPGERVLDIGSGTGASVELLVEQLGRTDAAHATRPAVVAIDRSTKAVERIRQRVPRAVADGTVDLRVSDLSGLDPDVGPVDAAIAVNVNVFWTSDAAAELDALARAMAPGGRLLIAYGDGPARGIDRRHLDRVEASVAASPAFEVSRRLDGDHGSAIVAVRTAAAG